ncbi:hypothetical protein TNIN_75191, partial [Trichonephila inaurata madagascariensis]
MIPTTSPSSWFTSSWDSWYPWSSSRCATLQSPAGYAGTPNREASYMTNGPMRDPLP